MKTTGKEVLRLEHPRQSPYVVWKLLLLAVAWPGLARFPAFSQVQSPPPHAATAAIPAADPTLGLSFDVVSIRRTGQGSSRVTNPADGDGITITNSTLREIVQWNYGLGRLHNDRIQGAPDWFSSFDDNYEIHAKVALRDVATWQKLDDEGRRLVFRKVLADRFKFACHFVNLEEPVYNLVVAKGGPKVKEAKQGEVNSLNSNLSGVPGQLFLGPGMTMHMTSDGMHAVFQEINMSVFARSDVFTYGLDRPVIDKTGLTGMYDFTLNVGWERLSAEPLAGGASESPLPDIFTAVQQQLGLKLEPARGLVSHLVVDHIERPSDN